jgi:GTP-binding protein
MPKLPLVAIIGKPNTGKSTLFNRLIGERKAIVSEIAGTTRDHIAHRIEGTNVDYLLVDTGGMGGGTTDKDFEDDVDAQSELAVKNADVIIFLVNGKEEMTVADERVIDALRKKRKRHVPVVIAISKVDNPKKSDELIMEYEALGLADHVIPISAPHNMGIDELEETIEKELTALHFGKQPQEEEDDAPRIAIVGRPNVGKSSIVNAFMSETQRSKSPLIVSDIPGTTRDSTDTDITFHGKKFILTDTAGLKKNRKTDIEIERFAELRTIQSLEQADIVVLVIDAAAGVSRQDKRIAGLAVESGAGLIFLLNKIDLLSSEERVKLNKEIVYHFPFCRFATMIPCSAETREGLLHIFPAIEEVSENRVRRIPTAKLMSWYQKATGNAPVRRISKANYITQAEIKPPTFVVFVSDPKKVSVSDLRFLDNRIRESFPFEGTPIRWVTKGKHDVRKEKDEEGSHNRF